MIKLNEVEVGFTKFPNGELSLDMEKLQVEPNGSANLVSWFYESNDEFVKLKMLEDVLENAKGYSDKDTYCHIAYMPYSRMDRGSETRPFTLKVVAEMMPKEWNYVVTEPHSAVTLEQLKLNVVGKVVKHDYSLKQLGRMLDAYDIIVFPDKGAYERYALDCEATAEMLNEKVILIGEKKRDFTTGNIESLELNSPPCGGKSAVVRGNYLEALIVDDLCSYGGTFIKVVEQLCKEMPFETSVDLLVAHAEDSICKGDLLDNVREVYTTDSILSKNEQRRFDIAVEKLDSATIVTDSFPEILDSTVKHWYALYTKDFCVYEFPEDWIESKRFGNTVMISYKTKITEQEKSGFNLTYIGKFGDSEAEKKFEKYKTKPIKLNSWEEK